MSNKSLIAIFYIYMLAVVGILGYLKVIDGSLLAVTLGLGVAIIPRLR